MQVAELPVDEEQRLKLLEELSILDTESEEELDEITKTAAEICEVPTALISLVDKDRQWFKSSYGLDAKETPRDVAFCAHAILQDGAFEVPDSLKDERFSDNPLVTSDPYVRYYIGIPLQIEDESHEKRKLGTLCLLDKKPRKLSLVKINLLKCLARQVEVRMELRRQLKSAMIVAYESTKKILSQQETILCLSHELKTPIHAILGFSELLQDSEKEPEKLKLLKYIISNTSQLSILIDDILELSKAKSNSLQVVHHWFDFKTFFDEEHSVLQSSRYKKPSTTMKFRSSIPTGTKIKLDKTKLQQILHNLTNNAMKFTPHGIIHITFEIRSSNLQMEKEKTFSEESDHELVLRVRDTGTGIPPEMVESIFLPFNKIKQEDQIEGVGLGLAITKNLTNIMAGKIDVTSSIGIGSEFVVSLPCSVSKNQEIDSQNNSPKEAHSIVRKNFRVVVTDDNHLNRTLLELSLKKDGYEVIGFSNGADTLKELEKNPADLLLADFQMPNMNGAELIKTVREQLKLIKLPIMIISAGEISEIKDQTQGYNISDILKKPLRRKELLEKVEQVVAFKQEKSETVK